MNMPAPIRYAGFWPRALAFVIDSLLLMPLLALFLALFRQSILLAIVGNIGFGLLICGYEVYFHARWGQNLGKMFARIKVTKLDGSSIGWRHALIRYLVYIVLWAVGTAGTVYALITWSGSEWSALTSKERYRAIAEHDPVNRTLYQVINQVLVLTELVVLLVSSKRRALHDYIAGTVVIHTRARPDVFKVTDLRSAPFPAGSPPSFFSTRRGRIFLAIGLALLVLSVFRILVPIAPR
jgi:uncharacterized RDD family membrane protein YckC